MKFCYNTNFTLPKQSQRSRSVLQDGSKYLGLFWTEKTTSYKQRNTLPYHLKVLKKGLRPDLKSNFVHGIAFETPKFAFRCV